MKKIFGSFKNIKLRTMLIVVPVTLAYPVIRAIISKANRLTVFSDALFITSILLIFLGVLFTFTRFGDFDITRYIFHRGVNKEAKPFGEYKKDREDFRDETFNYPLFFGLTYLSLSAFISFVFC